MCNKATKPAKTNQYTPVVTVAVRAGKGNDLLKVRVVNIMTSPIKTLKPNPVGAILRFCPPSLSENAEDNLCHQATNLLLLCGCPLATARIERGLTATCRADKKRMGQMLVPSPRSVLPGVNMELYQSAYGEMYLSQNVMIDYWISDDESQVVEINQEADSYRSTLIITLTELS